MSLILIVSSDIEAIGMAGLNHSTSTRLDNFAIFGHRRFENSFSDSRGSQAPRSAIGPMSTRSATSCGTPQTSCNNATSAPMPDQLQPRISFPPHVPTHHCRHPWSSSCSRGPAAEQDSRPRRRRHATRGRRRPPSRRPTSRTWSSSPVARRSSTSRRSPAGSAATASRRRPDHGGPRFFLSPAARRLTGQQMSPLSDPKGGTGSALPRSAQRRCCRSRRLEIVAPGASSRVGSWIGRNPDGWEVAV